MDERVSGSVINTEMVTFSNVLAPMKMGVLCSSGEKATEKSNKRPLFKKTLFFGKKIQTHAISSCVKNFFQQWRS